MRCPALMKPDATAKALTQDGFYITGDVFRRDPDGFYYFIGRADDMFVSGGENIYPGEIEAMLERHPDIHQAVVVPIDDELKFKKAGRLCRGAARRWAERRSDPTIRTRQRRALLASAAGLGRA
jgi:acyl-CoA synthetase (AMP-forming)/AMP-acid ligase II